MKKFLEANSDPKKWKINLKTREKLDQRAGCGGIESMVDNIPSPHISLYTLLKRTRHWWLERKGQVTKQGTGKSRFWRTSTKWRAESSPKLPCATEYITLHIMQHFWLSKVLWQLLWFGGEATLLGPSGQQGQWGTQQEFISIHKWRTCQQITQPGRIKFQEDKLVSMT